MYCCCKKTVNKERISLVKTPLVESPNRSRVEYKSPPQQKTPPPEIQVQAKPPPKQIEMPTTHYHQPQQHIHRVELEPRVSYIRQPEHQHVTVTQPHVRESRYYEQANHVERVEKPNNSRRVEGDRVLVEKRTYGGDDQQPKVEYYDHPHWDGNRSNANQHHY